MSLICTGAINILIPLGTLRYKNALWRLCTEFFESCGANVIISTGGAAPIVPQRDTRLRIRAFVDQQSGLPHCDVFITHGGTNSFHEAVYCGVPMLVVPQGGDQFLNARTVEDPQIGVSADNEQWPKMDLGKVIRQIVPHIYEERMPWTDYGDFTCRNQRRSMLAQRFLQCEDASFCRTLLKDRLYCCSRAAFADDLGLVRTDESVCLDEIANEDGLQKELARFYQMRCGKICNYCDKLFNGAVLGPGRNEMRRRGWH